LAETERIPSWPNARNVNIGPQYHNVVLQLGCSGRAQNLIPCVIEKSNIVAAFLAPDWHLNR
jgi:hypothetical protein